MWLNAFLKQISVTLVLPEIGSDRLRSWGRRSERDKELAQSDNWLALALAFNSASVEDVRAGPVRAAQIATVLRLTPLIVLTNVINIAVVLLLLWNAAPAPLLVLWTAACVFMLYRSSKAWGRSMRQPVHWASARAVKKVAVNATLFSACWAAVPLIGFYYGDADTIWVISCIVTAMICAGGFVLATMPLATILWVSVLATGSTIALLLQPSFETVLLLLLLPTYSLIVVSSSAAWAWLFISKFLAEVELRQRGELISLLMNEFEEDTSYWLWQTKANGFFKRISERFLKISGRTRSELQSLQMMDLAKSAQSDAGRRALAELELAISERRSFRDYLIAVMVNGEERWWSVSGRPIYSNSGNFTGFRGVCADVTEACRANALIEHLAENDALTGIGNRIWFLKQAESRFAQNRNFKRLLAIFLIDLDHFKVVNDTTGHPGGDQVLKIVAQRFKARCGKKVGLARIGSDEFAAIGEFRSERDARLFAEKLIAATSAPFRIGEHRISISATIGYAHAPKHGTSADELMRNADIALYNAKQSERGTALCFRGEMERDLRERRALEAALREALAKGQLALQFQPIVDARTGKVACSEVLIRWNHPERGNIPPGMFIPIAEQAGLILPIGEWVLKTACTIAARSPELKSISVNLSPVQFMSADLVKTVSDVLQETGFAPQCLILEVTESIFIEDQQLADRILTDLKELGVQIALDDFGTGYSSLSYLRKFKFDKIKIDKMFVDEIGVRSDGLAIIAAVITLAHNLGLETIAEGVETRYQVDALRTLGCDYLQGFYFGRPRSNPIPEKIQFDFPQHNGSDDKVRNATTG